jgi:hypothetical protein
MPAHIVTTEDLIDFKRELLEDIKAIVNESPSEAKRWLRSPEVSQLLDISPGTLQNLRINGTLPFSKVGGVLYYPYEGIMRVLQENLVNQPNQPTR